MNARVRKFTEVGPHLTGAAVTGITAAVTTFMLLDNPFLRINVETCVMTVEEALKLQGCPHDFTYYLPHAELICTPQFVAGVAAGIILGWKLGGRFMLEKEAANFEKCVRLGTHITVWYFAFLLVGGAVDHFIVSPTEYFFDPLQKILFWLIPPLFIFPIMLFTLNATVLVFIRWYIVFRKRFPDLRFG